MAGIVDSGTGVWTAEDLVHHFGAIPLQRIRTEPPPGTATKEDLLAVNEHGNRLCELVDGVLVEKTMGGLESDVAATIVEFLKAYVRRNRLGTVLGADGSVAFAPKLVRVPDVSFFTLDSLPGGRRPRDPAWDIVPALAVEVISRSNTRQEMDRKLRDYFAAGVRMVWYVYPDQAEAHVFTSLEQCTAVDKDGALEGGEVVPGFRLPMKVLLAEPGEPIDLSEA